MQLPGKPWAVTMIAYGVVEEGSGLADLSGHRRASQSPQENIRLADTPVSQSPMPSENDQPATKGDLALLRQDVKDDLALLKDEMNQHASLRPSISSPGPSS